MEEIGEKYRKGLISLTEAASLARVSIYEMMDFIEREKIRVRVLTEDDMEAELNNAQRVSKKLNMG